ncbi:MAG: c-type cytochrome [Deltaproteobacteria bacterium]|nr:c-type cytochrome [Deltaproteobacteria bacterium]
MIEFVYQALADIGYTHPLHPSITHVPVGLVIGAFVFGLAALLLRRPALGQTARHCVILALIALLPTVLLGYMDWQHRFAGTWLFPITMKLISAGVLLILLVIAVILGRRYQNVRMSIFVIYVLCLATVLTLGYFGGELIYGKKAAVSGVEEGLAREGALLFDQSCSMCHYTDTTETKIGPGLKGLFKRGRLPGSGRPVTEANVRNQLKTPFENMPSFADLPEVKVGALLAFLKTL